MRRLLKWKEKIEGKLKNEPPSKLSGKPHVNQPSSEHAQPSAPGSPAVTPPQKDKDINVEDLWKVAYDVVQAREKGLMEEYKKHLSSHPAIQINPTDPSSNLLSNADTVESIVQQLQDDRKNKQWRIHFGSKDIAIREQVEMLAKFLIWSDTVVSAAVSSQPYAALAWTGVTLLLPVSEWFL